MRLEIVILISTAHCPFVNSSAMKSSGRSFAFKREVCLRKSHFLRGAAIPSSGDASCLVAGL
jgi:hypothetical protein